MIIRCQNSQDENILFDFWDIYLENLVISGSTSKTNWKGHRREKSLSRRQKSSPNLLQIADFLSFCYDVGKVGGRASDWWGRGECPMPHGPVWVIAPLRTLHGGLLHINLFVLPSLLLAEIMWKNAIKDLRGNTKLMSFPRPNWTGPKPVRGQGTVLRIFSGRVGEFYFGLDNFLPGYETFFLGFQG